MGILGVRFLEWRQCLLLADFLLGLIINPEDEGDNVFSKCQSFPNYTALQPK
jgi:hypothetical protein